MQLTINGYTTHEVALRGSRFSYLEWGDPSDPPMVLLHGLTGHAHIWDHMAPAFAERFRVLALDQRGHGDTGHAASYATQDFVEDLEAFAGATALERFVLMGLSMGGHNAMAYAAAHPKRVAQLIVIDIPPHLRRDLAPNREAEVKLAKVGHKGFSSFDEAVEAARAGNPTAPEENLRYRTQWNLNPAPDGTLLLKWDPHVQVGWRPTDLWPALPSLGMPTLLVRGGKTLVLPLQTAERMISALPDAKLAEVADSGHSVPTDRPEALQAIVLDWLASEAGA